MHFETEGGHLHTDGTYRWHRYCFPLICAYFIHGLRIYHLRFVLSHKIVIYGVSLGISDDLPFNLGLIYAVVNSWYSIAWNLGFVRPSARFCELLTKPILLISCDLCAFRAACVSSIIFLARVTSFRYNSRIFSWSPSIGALPLAVYRLIPITYELKVNHLKALQRRLARQTVRKCNAL